MCEQQPDNYEKLVNEKHNKRCLKFQNSTVKRQNDALNHETKQHVKNSLKKQVRTK
jgi:hypothetical protein